MISYDEFKKIEVRAGKVLTAEKIPNTLKLLRLTVDFGEKVMPDTNPFIPSSFEEQIGTNTTNIATNANSGLETVTDSSPVSNLQSQISTPKPRQIVSGIALHYPDPTVLIGKTFMFVTNLEPRTIKGFESNGMIFAVSNSDGGFSLLEPNDSIKPGNLAA